MSHGNTIK